jgi:hypothetical protein
MNYDNDIEIKMQRLFVTLSEINRQCYAGVDGFQNPRKTAA